MTQLNTTLAEVFEAAIEQCEGDTFYIKVHPEEIQRLKRFRALQSILVGTGGRPSSLEALVDHAIDVDGLPECVTYDDAGLDREGYVQFGLKVLMLLPSALLGEDQ